MIEEVVAPVLHSNEPGDWVDNTVFPQLLVTDTVGTEGTVKGAEAPVPAALVHPLNDVEGPVAVTL